MLQIAQAPALQEILARSMLTMMHTAMGSITLTVIPLGGLSAPTTLSVSGLPAGVTAAFSKSAFAVPGNGIATLTFIGSPAAKAGTSPITITARSSVTTSSSIICATTQTLSLVLE
jgi:hypothetical protein